MMKNRKVPFILFSVMFAILLLMHSCKKPHDTVPANPYDKIHRDDTTLSEIPVDSLTITYVHKKVLSTRCALPGCHVGNFEPDFRTPQSSFSTLVYAPIKKNDTLHTFKYRVVPFDPTHSVLHERISNCCFVRPNDRMPQDNIGVPLPDSSINLITQWIVHGARDMFGNIAHLPNEEPVITGYLAFDTVSLVPPFAQPSVVYDTVRLDNVYYNPFLVPAAKSVFYIAFQPTDDSTAMSQFTNNKLKISTSADDFSSAWQFSPVYFNLGGYAGWLVTVPTASLPQNDTLFMRYYLNDGSHVNNSEFPRTELPFPYKTYWSFIRQ